MLTIKNIELKSGFNINYRKEDKFFKQMTACYIVDGRICERLIVRFYATDATTYCCVWLYKDGKAHNGSGKAGGWGYDRSSAALDQAFKAMGIDFGHTLSGTGQNEEAIIKIGRELGEEWQVMTAQG